MNESESEAKRNTQYFDNAQLRSKLKQRALKGVGATVFSQMTSFWIHFAGSVVLARILTPDDFGLVTMATTFSLLMQNFGLNGFTEAIIQKPEINQRQINSIFWVNLSCSLALTLLLMALSPGIALVYSEPRLVMVVIAISLAIISSGLSTIHLALLQRNMQFYLSSGCMLIARIGSIVLAVLAAWYGFGYWAIVINAVSAPLITAVAAWAFCKWKPGLPTFDPVVKPMLRFALNIYGNFSMNYFSRNLDNLLIGWYNGPQALGHYKKAYDLFILPVSQLTAPLANVALAALSRLYDEPEKYKRYYLDSLSLLAFLGMLVSVVFFISGKDMVRIILGPQWDLSGEIFILFSPGIGIMLIYNTNGWLHLSSGNPGRWLRWGILEFLVICAAVIISLPFGPKGVALAITLAFYALVLPGLVYAGKPVNLMLRSIVSEIWRYMLSAMAAGMIANTLITNFNMPFSQAGNTNIFLRIVFSGSIATALYVAIVLVLYGNSKPLKQFFSLLRNMMPGFRQKKVDF